MEAGWAVEMAVTGRQRDLDNVSAGGAGLGRARGRSVGARERGRASVRGGVGTAGSGERGAGRLPVGLLRFWFFLPLFTYFCSSATGCGLLFLSVRAAEGAAERRSAGPPREARGFPVPCGAGRVVPPVGVRLCWASL